MGGGMRSCSVVLGHFGESESLFVLATFIKTP